jgi:hypothetical protein
MTVPPPAVNQAKCTSFNKLTRLFDRLVGVSDALGSLSEEAASLYTWHLPGKKLRHDSGCVIHSLVGR